MTEEKIENEWPSLLQIVFALLVISSLTWYAVTVGPSKSSVPARWASPTTITVPDEEVLPSAGVRLSARLGNLGPQLVQYGVIDKEKFLALYEGDPLLKGEAEKLLDSSDYGELAMTEENSPVILNFLWALGLANKNPILEEGEMMNPAYGGAGNFASTGGWTISRSTGSGQAAGDAMEHYSKYALIDLTLEQQELVDKVSRGIYRPCCNNSTHFPDCNHGMAMLGLLELLASQGASEEEMYKAALAANSYWFPDTYITIAAYMKGRGVEWKNVDPKEVLEINYSSASGFANVASQVTASSRSSGGGGCLPAQAGGVGPLDSARGKQQSGCAVERRQSGCGV